VNDKRSYAHDPHDVDLRRRAKQALKYPPVRFNEAQRQAIANGFAKAVQESNYLVHALCIGHDHSHAILSRHERAIEQVARHLKSKATMELTQRGLHPLKECRKPDGAVPTPWAVDCWSVFINDTEQLRAAIRYVERHPEKEGLKPQRWDFVSRYAG
jgi:REP element-mobilizing transposase RayT